MTSTLNTRRNELQDRLADFSQRVSVSAVPMLPFVRFGQTSDQKNLPKRFWDFEYEIQKRLLACLHSISSADEIADLGVKQWKRNLGTLLVSKRQLLHHCRVAGFPSDLFTTIHPKFSTIVDRLPPGARLLYIGAGSGTECLGMAAQGLQVVGIDTISPLLAIGREYANHLKRNTSFACMNVMSTGFKSASFDGFTIEFYGAWPTRNQTLQVQHELARILKPNGLGFITAARKSYQSYWHLMGSPYSPAMTEWLIPYSNLDFLFSEADAHEEQLRYGLFEYSHTAESLTAELGWSFEVLECQNDSDPRYLNAVVRRRPDVDLNSPLSDGDQANELHITPANLTEVEEMLVKVEQLIEQLENHARQVVDYFASGAEARDCLKTVKPALSTLAARLDAIW